MESIIQKALKLLLDKFGATYDCVTISEENEHYRANIETTESARLIGKNGDTLNAIQTLVKNILYAQNHESIFLTVDIDGYKKQKEDKVLIKAEKFIEIMKAENLAEIKLTPMTPYYRRIVHTWLVQKYPELTSNSVGEGGQRSVRIFYK